jgi:hypothetical protein
MRHYCSLFMRSDRQDQAHALFEPSVIASLQFEDLHSPERLARSQRLRSVGLVSRSDLPRYSWSLNSGETVGTDETDPYIHVAWLLSQFKPGISLVSERDRGVEFSLSFYWGGGGTGGGPFISTALAELLLRHQLGLDVGFYFEGSGNAV